MLVASGVALVLVLAVEGCTRSASPASVTSPGAPTTTRGEPVTGTIGSALPFSGLTLTVASQVTDPAPPADAFVRPDPNTRYVQVSVSVVNGSAHALSFTPVVEAALVDDAGGTTHPVPALYASDLAGEDVPAGGQITGTLSFALASARAPQRLLFTDLAGVTTTVVLH
jgi:uncharacterized protein DUF4352